MRCFAVMYDDAIKPVVNMRKTHLGDIYFEVDGKLFRYTAFRYDCESFPRRCVLMPDNSFQRFLHEDWIDTREIKYLIALNEEEDKDLNYFQSTDFNAGIIYTYVEKTAGHMISNKDRYAASTEVVLPRVQLVPKGCGSVKEVNTLTAMLKCVTKHFDAVYGKSFTLRFDTHYTSNQFYCIPFTIIRKTEYKEMTVAEIEEALGYKIKVVGEK